jgi:hypothetical protein
MELDWRPEDYKPDEYQQIPAGDYLAVIEEEECKDNASGTGELLIFTFQITEGEFKGRKIRKSLNIRHTNPKAETIARQQLSSIQMACGKPLLRNTLELQGIPLIIRVGMNKRKPILRLRASFLRPKRRRISH